MEFYVLGLDGFQSTLPARGATDLAISEFSEYVISIHAPREGSDEQIIRTARPTVRISIHAPREGSDGAPNRTQ